MCEGACGAGTDGGRSIKCPICKNLIFESRGFNKCYHCGYELTELYIQECLEEEKKNSRSNLKLAIIIVPMIFAGMYYLFDYLLK